MAISRSTEYGECVAHCKDLFDGNNEALVACINGCAVVNAPSGQVVAVDEVGRKIQSEIPALGSFVAVPDAFPGADPGVQNAVKFEFTTVFSDENRVQTLFSSDRVLIDLAAVAPSKLDFKKLAIDCDLIKGIAEKHPDELRECLIALQTGGSSGIQKAEKITKNIGLTEENFAKAGGGFFFVAVAVAIALGAGGCATCNSNKPFKQSTTPKPKPPESDAGPGDAG
ncbi:MAG: hypothetical protein JSV82_02155 [Planctomycetota bacterium]|nr:MAG: hypothetical protein JSV82_02155 [Planctomycetota bacterium]